MSVSQTPAQLGYRMPAEFETHAATWMTWPSRRDTSFPGEGKHDRVLPTFIRMIEALTQGETVYLNCADPDDRAYVLANTSSKAQESLILTDIPATYPWCRDHGAIFLHSPDQTELAAACWIYNAWGNKYPEILATDAAIPDKMADLLGVKKFHPGIVLEGGSIDVNGCGTLITTESCLLNKNRNPHLTRRQIEQYLEDYLAIEKVVWLTEGVAGDDTDGHIDDITRFINTETVVTVVEENQRDPNYEALYRNYELLCRTRTEDDSSLNVLVLPMPAPLIEDGERLPASYANFYIGNKSVLVPVFNDPNDERALRKLQECFPDRTIVPIDSRAVVWGLGSFHCLTQQVPAVRAAAGH